MQTKSGLPDKWYETLPGWNPVMRSSTGPTPPIRFLLFQDFPEEIRRQIWRHSLPSRLIDVRLKAWHSDGRRPSSIDQFPRKLPKPCRIPLPPQFRVCRESRSEVQSLYRPFPGGPTFTVAEGVLVNFDVDTLYCADKLFDLKFWRYFQHPAHPEGYYFPDRFLPSRLAYDEDVIKNVTRLAIPLSEFEILNPRIASIHDVVGALQEFPKLRELILVDAEFYEGWGLQGLMRGWTPDPGASEGVPELAEVDDLWQPNDNKEQAIMTGNFLQFNIAASKLRNVEGWTTPEIKYAWVVRRKHSSN